MDTATTVHPLRELVRRAEPITGEELAALPDLGPCELIEGRIIEMSPTNWRHGVIVGRVTARLHEFAGRMNDLRVLTGEVGIYTGSDPDTVRGADVLVISSDRLFGQESTAFLRVPPELVVEVYSPSNTPGGMERKIAEYLEAGVDHVWLIRAEARRVHVFDRDGGEEVLEDGDVLRGVGIVQGFELALADLFAD